MSVLQTGWVDEIQGSAPEWAGLVERSERHRGGIDPLLFPRHSPRYG
jgi:hypothetical protein